MADNWSIVGYGSDPIPDDPGIVAAQVDHIKAVAADLAAQIANLPTDGAIDAVPWQSDTGAPLQFKQVIKKLPTDLDKLKVRYEKVGAAMGAFQVTLANAKAQAQANLAKAVTAHNDIAAAQAGVTQMNDFAAQAQHQANTQNASAKPGTPPVHAQPWTGPDYHAQLSAAQAAFNAAKAAIDQAVNQFHDAARTAAAAVGAASHDDLKNDTSIWGSIVNSVESFCHWVAQNVPLQAISGLLNKIAAVAAILSFIPVIGEVAGVVALVAAGGAFLCDAITALSHAYTGDFSFQDGFALGMDAAGFAVSGWASSLESGAELASAAAKGATVYADGAKAAVTTAEAEQLAAQIARDGALAKVTNWTRTDTLWTKWIQTPVGRVTGITARAQSALGASTTELAQANATLAQANAAAAAARAAVGTTAQAAKVARLAVTSANVVGTSINVGQAANSVATEPVPPSNPVVALVRSTTWELGAIANWNDNPTGSTAQLLGSQIPAQPIPILSGG